MQYQKPSEGEGAMGVRDGRCKVWRLTLLQTPTVVPLLEPVAVPLTVIHAGGELENAWTYRTPLVLAAASTLRCVMSALQSHCPSLG